MFSDIPLRPGTLPATLPPGPPRSPTTVPGPRAAHSRRAPAVKPPRPPPVPTVAPGPVHGPARTLRPTTSFIARNSKAFLPRQNILGGPGVPWHMAPRNAPSPAKRPGHQTLAKFPTGGQDRRYSSGDWSGANLLMEMLAGGDTSNANGCLVNSGLYVLWLEVRRDIVVRVGALGPRRFTAGWYAYTGSARANLGPRVRRHLAKTKPLRWHVDHLTAHPAVRVAAVLTWSVSRGSECALNRLVAARIQGTAPVSRFGASDCREGCEAHLWRAGTRVAPEDIARALDGGIYFRPSSIRKRARTFQNTTSGVLGG